MGSTGVAVCDGDWAEFTPAQRAAFTFARKLTYEPHLLGAADIDAPDDAEWAE